MEREVLRSEFASVEVARDESANGVRLLVRDLATGNSIYLDPFELETLTRLKHVDFVHFLDLGCDNPDDQP
jgi:hypothetical protein